MKKSKIVKVDFHYDIEQAEKDRNEEEQCKKEQAKKERIIMMGEANIDEALKYLKSLADTFKYMFQPDDRIEEGINTVLFNQISQLCVLYRLNICDYVSKEDYLSHCFRRK